MRLSQHLKTIKDGLLENMGKKEETYQEINTNYILVDLI